MNRREYFREEELKEMLIAAENFGCMAEVLADLGMTAEEAREIIWGEDQERVEKPFFIFGEYFSRARCRPGAAEFPRFNTLALYSDKVALSRSKVIHPESALHCVKAQKDCTKIKT